MTYGKRQFEDLDPVMRQLIPPFHQAMNQLIAIVDRDSLAFSSYMVSEAFILLAILYFLHLVPLDSKNVGEFFAFCLMKAVFLGKSAVHMKGKVKISSGNLSYSFTLHSCSLK